MRPLALALLLIPTGVVAGDVTVEAPMVPLAPPGVMAHAAYMTLSNGGDAPAQLIGVRAEGYAMAHIHMTEEKDGVATMSGVDLVEIAPGQSVVFERGGLHIMLMRPEGARAEGDMVALELEFADGSITPVAAKVMKMHHAGHGDHGGHGS